MIADLAPVLTQQHPEELEMILDIYRELKPSRVLEIGSLQGGTLYHWLKNAEPGAIVASIDLPLNIAAQVARLKWGAWADEFGVKLGAWIGDSGNPILVRRARNLAPYDFIFVDGDHSRDGVSRDFDNYFQMVRVGGCIAFHDIAAPDDSRHIQVGTWWRQLVATGKYNTQELVRFAGSDSGGIGVIWRE